MMSCTLVTVPYWEKASRSRSSVVENDMFPTYKFFATELILAGPEGQEHQCRQVNPVRMPIVPVLNRTVNEFVEIV
jgi:hypothetical protein